MLDYFLYHLDGMEQIRHLDTLLSIPRFHTLQWTQSVSRPVRNSFPN